jgi:hypothetical protein
MAGGNLYLRLRTMSRTIHASKCLILLKWLLKLAAMLKLMFIYNLFIMLDDKSVRKCVCVLATTLTRSNIWKHELCATLSATVNINCRLPFKVYITARIYIIVFGYIYLLRSRDLNIELLTMSTDTTWKLCVLELKDILRNKSWIIPWNISVIEDNTFILIRLIVRTQNYAIFCYIYCNNRSLYKFIANLSNSIHNISSLLIFVFNMFNNEIYAADVLRTLLSVNRWVSKLRNIEIRSKTRIVWRC